MIASPEVLATGSRPSTRSRRKRQSHGAGRCCAEALLALAAGDGFDGARRGGDADRGMGQAVAATSDFLNCRDVNFDPVVLPSGIELSDDPLLRARSAAYATSFTRRAGEEKEPNGAQIPGSGRGA